MQRDRGKIYYALNHPIRRKIVELLRTHETLGSSELKELLNIGPGKLYYHLENLGSLVEQDEERRYRLSKEGREAYHLLIAGETLPVKERAVTSTPLLRFLNTVKSALLFTGLMSHVYRNPVRHIPEGIILVLFGGWLCNIAGLQPVLLYYVNQNQIWYWSLAQFLVGWLHI